uniref:Uncharacterized protein n=1 Tax=Medicago truncatula TaxID=3880 RepID=I3S2V4_MEDTR|nr:unknown [Medicago truncatula]
MTAAVASSKHILIISRDSFFCFNSSTIYDMFFHNNAFGNRRISKNNKSKTTSTSRGPILHYHSFNYISKVLKILSESVFICIPGNPSNE